MALQTAVINSVKMTFDKENTKAHRTDLNKPCDCQDCRNFYQHIEGNAELLDFLHSFGIDHNCAEEVFSWELDDHKESLIHHEGYYGVFGKIEGEEFDFEKYGVKITFAKAASVPCDREDAHFWITIAGDFPYILDEKRESSVSASQEASLNAEETGKVLNPAQVLFENSHTRNKELAKEIYNYYYFRRPFIVVLYILFGLSFLANLLGLLLGGTYNISVLVFAPCFFFLEVFLYHQQVNTILKRDLEVHGKEITVETTVTDAFVQNTASTGSVNKLQYQNIRYAVQTKNLILLHSKTNSVYILRKDAFTKGDAETFLRFLKYKEIKVK